MKNETPFAVGDKVLEYKVREMTVVEIYDARFRYRYRCAWTGRDGEDEHELFQASQLTRVKSGRAESTP